MLSLFSLLKSIYSITDVYIYKLCADQGLSIESVHRLYLETALMFVFFGFELFFDIPEKAFSHQSYFTFLVYQL